MKGHGHAAGFSDHPPTLVRHLAAERWLAACAWSFGTFSIVAEWVTGGRWWHVAALSTYIAILPVGVALSTMLRTRQRDVDRLWGQRFRELSIRDDLTGLYNRRQFNAELVRLARECLNARTPLSLAFVDLNDFKAINDTYGHEAGDEALRTVAHCLVELTGQRGVVARTGGDEFGILLPGMSEADATALFGPVCRTVPVPLGRTNATTVGGTVGIASLDGSADVSSLLRRADIRLYENKRARDQARRIA